MNQQEIKDNMTKLVWVANPTGYKDNEFGVLNAGAYASGRFVIGDTNSNFHKLGVYNTAAIVSAVNGTYGINVNPCKVKELYDMLFELSTKQWLLNELSVADRAELVELLNSSKLKDNL